MIRHWLLILVFCLLSFPVCAAEMTQREWMVQLIGSLGWDFGLPDEPEDEDYIRLLSGSRDILLEAEANHQKSDLVAVKRYTNYGTYSGEGWVSGLRQTTRLKLAFLLPHKGAYHLAASTRLPGVRLQLAGREFVLDSDELFTRHELGEIELPSGQAEIIVELPPQAGIDYIELTAPPLTAIAPLGGWKPDNPISAADLALTTLQALELQNFLPVLKRSQRIEAETYADIAGVQTVRDRHLGVPSGGAWLRAGNQQASLRLPLRRLNPGCYILQVRASSEQPISFELPGLLSRKVDFGIALNSKPAGSFCVSGQQSELQVELPAWAGIDMLEMIEVDSSKAKLIQLLGLPEGSFQVDSGVVNELLEMVSSLTY